MGMNNRFNELNGVIAAFGPVAPSSAAVQRFSMKDYGRATVLIVQSKSSGNGSAISLKQMKEIDNSPDTAKTLGLAKAYRSLAVGTQSSPANVWEEFTVASNTFTTSATNSVRDIYAIDILAEDLDVANDFDVVEVLAGDAAGNVIAIIVLLHDAKNGGFPTSSGIAD